MKVDSHSHGQFNKKFDKNARTQHVRQKSSRYQYRFGGQRLDDKYIEECGLVAWFIKDFKIIIDLSRIGYLAGHITKSYLL